MVAGYFFAARRACQHREEIESPCTEIADCDPRPVRRKPCRKQRREVSQDYTFLRAEKRKCGQSVEPLNASMRDAIIGSCVADLDISRRLAQSKP